MTEQVLKLSKNYLASCALALFQTSKVIFKAKFLSFNVIDQFKPYVCSFSSIFTLYHLLESKLPAKDLAAEYCSKLKDVELAKLELIISLASLTLDSTFKEKCMHKVS